MELEFLDLGEGDEGGGGQGALEPVDRSIILSVMKPTSSPLPGIALELIHLSSAIYLYLSMLNISIFKLSCFLLFLSIRDKEKRNPLLSRRPYLSIYLSIYIYLSNRQGDLGVVWVTPRRQSPDCEFGDATAILKSLR